MRKLSAQMGISLGSAHTAVRKMLKFYPYRMQVFHELIPGDNAKRFNYCRWFKNLIRGNIGVLDQVFFLQTKRGSTSVVTQITKTTKHGELKTHIITQTPLHPQK